MTKEIQLNKLENITILYVEDDDEIRSIFVSILENFCDQLYVAEDGVEGLALYKEQSIDIIISDINMPRMNGLEMYQQIQEIDPDAKIIITSAYSDSEFLIQAISLGVTEYVLKPINFKLLFEKVNKIVKNIELKRNYARSKALLNQYKLAVDSSFIVSKTNSSGIITYVNNNFCEISGYCEDELIGQNHNIVKHPDTPKELFQEMWQTIKEEKNIFKGVIKNLKKDGDEYIVDVTILPLLDDKNNITEYIAIRTDITEHLAYKAILEEQLGSSNDMGMSTKIELIKAYESVFDENIGHARYDLEGNITYINQKCLNTCEHLYDDVVGKHFTFSRFDPDNQADKEMMQIVLSGNVWKGVVKNIRLDGSIYYLDTTVSPIFIQNKLVELVAINRDITDVILLNEEITDTQKDVIFTLGSIGEARSKETGNHVKRVAEYSYILAKSIGLNEDTAQLLKLASPMHDIGKVGIPDSILNKPGKLSDEEFNKMKRHADIGYNMLKSSKKEIIRASAEVAYTHHEKYNGKGYPNGLSGEDIPIFGRITAVADVFDALGSDRVYKSAWDLDKIYRLLKEESGKHFDPKIIDAFFKHLDQFLEIRDKYQDSFELDE